MFEFIFQTRICFGAGSRAQLANILTKHGWKRVGVVVDHNVMPVPLIGSTLDIIRSSCSKVVVGACTISEPTYIFLDEFRKQFMGEELDAVIGIGGGSALDAAKAVAVLVNNTKPALEYRGFDKMTEPVLPVIAVPTTAGTGSEVTPNASFIDSVEKRKLGINGEAVRPRYAVLDPELTLSCPAKASLSAGIDSMVHAVEACVAKKANPLARFFAVEGFKRVFRSLPQVIGEPGKIEAREEVMYGAFLAGVALMNSGTGPAAALSYPIGVHFGVPHGLGGGIFLPFVVQHNVRSGFSGYTALFDSLEVKGSQGAPDDVKCAQFAEALKSRWKELSVPDDLTKLGVPASFLPQYVKETMDLKGALDQNPVPFYEEQITKVLKEVKL